MLKIALVQTCSLENELEKNINTAKSICTKAASDACDLVLFPEIWHNGYPLWNPDRANYDDWLSSAETADSEKFLALLALAKQKELAIAYSFLEKRDGEYFNSMFLVDRLGEVVLRQSKIHICAWGGAESYLQPGTELQVADLITKHGSLKLGVMICMDREYPETARVLARKGAQLMLVPNACDLRAGDIGDLRIAQLRGRAWENHVAIAMANYAQPHNDGSSLLISPDGRLVAEASACDEIKYVDLDLEFLTAYRASELQMREDRRQPQLYQPIVDPKATRI